MFQTRNIYISFIHTQLHIASYVTFLSALVLDQDQFAVFLNDPFSDLPFVW